jgi:iron-sulfur cluster assembly protein
MDLTITDRAAERVLKAAQDEGVDVSTARLRIAVVPGGCSGLTYDLGWDTTIMDSDEVGELNGIPVVVDQKSALYLEGTELDFSDGLDGRGFHFLNPQAARECACGESFGL